MWTTLTRPAAPMPKQTLPRNKNSQDLLPLGSIFYARCRGRFFLEISGFNFALICAFYSWAMETFIRKELKYRISDAQKEKFLAAIADFIEPDLYPESNIYSIYLDTAQLDLLRICEGKPAFRQKVRIRAYQESTSPEDTVFFELKKKAEGVCMKSRSPFTLKNLCRFLSEPDGFDQNSKELAHVLEQWPLEMRFALYAHRHCWKWKGREDLRITIDDTLTYRLCDQYLGKSKNDQPLLKEGENILEIKCAQNLPRELAGILFENSIQPASFSKAGQVYAKLLERNQTLCRTI